MNVQIYQPDGTEQDDKPENPKDRLGIKKPPLHLIPPCANIIESKVMELGAAKYGPFNWRDTNVLASVYVSAAMRHLLAWFDGENFDPESRMSHLAHARACMGIMLDALISGRLLDDRPTAGKASQLIAQLTAQEDK